MIVGYGGDQAFDDSFTKGELARDFDLAEIVSVIWDSCLSNVSKLDR